LSHGTENRKNALVKIPPNSETWDYVTFRTADIRDIKVTNSNSAVLGDPAIVSMGSSTAEEDFDFES
jgi:hypothetical protein